MDALTTELLETLWWSRVKFYYIKFENVRQRRDIAKLSWKIRCNLGIDSCFSLAGSRQRCKPEKKITQPTRSNCALNEHGNDPTRLLKFISNYLQIGQRRMRNPWRWTIYQKCEISCWGHDKVIAERQTWSPAWPNPCYTRFQCYVYTRHI